jgi:hypothetical protein
LEGYNNKKDSPLSAPRWAATGGWAAFILPPGATTAAAAHSGAAGSTGTAVLQRKLSLRAPLLAGQAVVHEVAVVLQHVLQVGVRRQILAKKERCFLKKYFKGRKRKKIPEKKEGCNDVASLNFATALFFVHLVISFIYEKQC